MTHPEVLNLTVAEPSDGVAYLGMEDRARLAQRHRKIRSVTTAVHHGRFLFSLSVYYRAMETREDPLNDALQQITRNVVRTPAVVAVAL